MTKKKIQVNDITIESNHEIATVGAAAGMTSAQRAALPPPMVESFKKGGKAMYASFYCFIAFVWSLKGCLLGFYYRLT